MDYKGNVTVKIDGIAASAASVIAMAGTEVLMSPVSTMMIHNPATVAMGDHNDMQKAIEMLNEVKESIINAYEIKTGLSRAKLSHLMDSETWMNANKAVELGFADGIIARENPNTEPDEEDEDEYEEEKDKNNPCENSVLFSRKAVNTALINKIEKHYSNSKGTPVSNIRERLNFIKKFI